MFIAGTDDGVAEGAALLSRAGPDVCTSSNAFVFPRAGDGVGDTVLGAAVTAFDAGAAAPVLGAAGTGATDSDVGADEVTDTGGADALDNDTGAGEGNGDSDGEGDGEGVVVACAGGA